MDIKKLVKSAFREVLEEKGYAEEKITEYFHPEYMQYVDGKTIDYPTFVLHIKKLKSTLDHVSIEFVHMIAEDNKVCSVHIARGSKVDGSEFETKVIAYMEVYEERIILCDELTFMMQGNESDRDLGSRH